MPSITVYIPDATYRKLPVGRSAAAIRQLVVDKYSTQQPVRAPAKQPTTAPADDELLDDAERDAVQQIRKAFSIAYFQKTPLVKGMLQQFGQDRTKELLLLSGNEYAKEYAETLTEQA